MFKQRCEERAKKSRDEDVGVLVENTVPVLRESRVQVDVTRYGSCLIELYDAGSGCYWLDLD